MQAFLPRIKAMAKARKRLARSRQRVYSRGMSSHGQRASSPSGVAVAVLAGHSLSSQSPVLTYSLTGF
jgi:hypothetical protein